MNDNFVQLNSQSNLLYA